MAETLVERLLRIMVENGLATLDSRGYYQWTNAVHSACPRWANVTPERWVHNAIGGRRHCAACGRDLYRKQVWERLERGPMKHMSICMECGRKGKTLLGLALDDIVKSKGEVGG